MAADPLASAPLLRTMFGAGDHLWSAGTLAAFMALPETGGVKEDGEALILTSPDCRARLRPGTAGLQLLAFETLSSDPRGWNHGIALCLSGEVGLPSARVTVTTDPDPIDPGGAGRPLFDLGLEQGAMRALFRPDTALPAPEGKPWAEAAPLLLETPGTWIIDTPFLRVERSLPSGPGLHSVDQALRSGRSHAETTPVPPGLIPLAHVFPPHPARHRPGAPMAFDPARHQVFQSILACHGRPGLWALKCLVQEQLHSGRFDPPPVDRHGAAVLRITLRQWLHLHGEVPRLWLAQFDRPLLRALEGP